MPVVVVLLRGVNLVSRNRVSMPELREALDRAGYDRVRTYVQSGNVVVTTDKRPEDVALEVGGIVSSRFGIDVGVLVRTRNELASVVGRDPLGSIATDPRLYQVAFLEQEPDAAVVVELEALAEGDERVAVDGREIFSWHPGGSHGSKLARRLSGTSFGLTTLRNWRTVTALLALADET